MSDVFPTLILINIYTYYLYTRLLAQKDQLELAQWVGELVPCHSRLQSHVCNSKRNYTYIIANYPFTKIMNSHALLLNARANSTPTKQKPTATFKHAMLKSPLRNPNTVNRNIMLLSPAQRKIALMNASPNSFLTQSPRKAIVSPSKTPRAVSVSELQINDTPQVNSKEDDEDSEMDVDENQSPNRSLANEFKLDAFESLNAPQIQNRGHSNDTLIQN